MKHGVCKTCKFSLICYGLGMQAVLSGIANGITAPEDIEKAWSIQFPVGCPRFETSILRYHIETALQNLSTVRDMFNM